MVGSVTHSQEMESIGCLRLFTCPLNSCPLNSVLFPANRKENHLSRAAVLPFSRKWFDPIRVHRYHEFARFVLGGQCLMFETFLEFLWGVLELVCFIPGSGFSWRRFLVTLAILAALALLAYWLYAAGHFI